jgi:hypothetical protein
VGFRKYSSQVLEASQVLKVSESFPPKFCGFQEVLFSSSGRFRKYPSQVLKVSESIPPKFYGFQEVLFSSSGGFRK